MASGFFVAWPALFSMASTRKMSMFSPMSRVRRFWKPALFAAALWIGAAQAFAAGFEDFGNFLETGSSYNDGIFLGQDGSTWTYVQCRGDKFISAPSPSLNKGQTPISRIESGTIAGGCGILSFDFMLLFSPTVRVDVVVSSTVRHTITGGQKDVATNTGPLTINQGGNFTLKLVQHDSKAAQVAIDNISWTSYGGADPEPPELLFSPDTNAVLTAYSNLVSLTVTATEPNVDAVALWATGLPAGAAFNATNGLTPLISSFSWRPSAAQTGTHAVVFYAGDKDGTHSRTFSIEVTPIYPYYHYAMGLTGTVLKAKLHDIISAGARQLTDEEENEAMKVLHTDPNNSSNVYYLYNVTSSVPKALYNKDPGWNKEHCWPESRGLGSTGPDQVDVHNLFAEDKGVNALRGNLYFDESNTNDAGYVSPTTNAAPQTSRDDDSWEPPPTSKGNVARGVFYMATRYDGSEDKTSALSFSDNPTHTNVMGILTNLLLWHAMDPPDILESNRNEIIYARYQHNRNPFIDHPEWVEKIWGVDPDRDGVTTTHEMIAGSDPNNAASIFEAKPTATHITCGALSTGSTWRLYQGTFVSNDILWQRIAETNLLQSGALRFPVAPTGNATFYHLRALRSD